MTPQLIDINLIKEFSVINENLDNKLIQPTLIMVQDVYLQEILGTDLYQDICTEVIAESVASGSMSAKYVTLLTEYIEPYLINMVVSEGMINWHVKITNKNVAISTSDHQFNATLTDIQQMTKNYLSIAETYAKRLTLYLCENDTTYPLYIGSNTNVEKWKIRPKSFEYSSSIFTGNRRYDHRKKRR
jgi:hypothetical protein